MGSTAPSLSSRQSSQLFSSISTSTSHSEDRREHAMALRLRDIRCSVDEAKRAWLSVSLIICSPHSSAPKVSHLTDERRANVCVLYWPFGRYICTSEPRLYNNTLKARYSLSQILCES